MASGERATVMLCGTLCPRPSVFPYYRTQDKKTSFLSPVTLGAFVKAAAQRAGIRKRVYPHLLLHSKATALAKQLTSQELMVFGGWKLSAIQIYIHLSGADIERKILEIRGLTAQQREYNSVIPVAGGRVPLLQYPHYGYPTKAQAKEGEFHAFLKTVFQKWKAAQNKGDPTYYECLVGTSGQGNHRAV